MACASISEVVDSKAYAHRHLTHKRRGMLQVQDDQCDPSIQQQRPTTTDQILLSACNEDLVILDSCDKS